jgi:hypothetical protein
VAVEAVAVAAAALALLTPSRPLQVAHICPLLWLLLSLPMLLLLLVAL